MNSESQKMSLALGLFVLSFILWETWLVYPIKLLTVLFHELSHGLAAIATGGVVARIEVYANEGGVCWTAGGNRILVLSAGYLGSLLWGSGLLLLAARTDWDREILAGLGGLLILVTVIWVRNLTGIVFGLGVGAAMIAFSKHLGTFACDVLLRWIGMTSSLYVILDIKSDLIDRSVAASDASKLAAMFMLPGWVVGGIWLIIALGITWKVLAATLPPDGTDGAPSLIEE